MGRKSALTSEEKGKILPYKDFIYLFIYLFVHQFECNSIRLIHFAIYNIMIT